MSDPTIQQMSGATRQDHRNNAPSSVRLNYARGSIPAMLASPAPMSGEWTARKQAELAASLRLAVPEAGANLDHRGRDNRATENLTVLNAVLIFGLDRRASLKQ
jgi:hypothetical protein